VGVTEILMVLAVASALIVVFSGGLARQAGTPLGLGNTALTAWSIAKWLVLALLSGTSRTGWGMTERDRAALSSAYVDDRNSSAYADGMMNTLEIAQGAASEDPDVGLRAVAALRALAERLEDLQVENARKVGWSWQEIALRLGVTKQTVHRKHGHRLGGR
jgi:hypothetical protein